MTKIEYLAMRRRYEPLRPKLMIVAESPPASGKYFYSPDGRTNEPLFAALIEQLKLGVTCATKEEGLRAFQRAAWILVDATYEPVNKLNDRERNRIIERDYPALRDDLTMLAPDRSVPLILIKANVCAILEVKLVQDGFRVLNRGTRLPFPSDGHQTRFREEFGAVLARHIGESE